MGEARKGGSVCPEQKAAGEVPAFAGAPSGASEVTGKGKARGAKGRDGAPGSGRITCIGA